MHALSLRPVLAAAALVVLAACGGGDATGSSRTGQVPPAQVQPPAPGNNPCRYSADAADRWISSGQELPGCLHRLQHGQ